MTLHTNHSQYNGATIDHIETDFDDGSMGMCSEVKIILTDGRVITLGIDNYGQDAYIAQQTNRLTP